MPTGVALRDPREQLFDAAGRILLRDGPTALTSRAVTTEAGCAKGVLHRYFADFDAFLAELIRARIARVAGRSTALADAAGTGTVAGNLTDAVLDLYEPVAVAVVALVVFRDDLRARLRATTPAGLPLISEATAMIRTYLSSERDLGRIAVDADVDSLSLALIGAGHLLFAAREAERPTPATVHKVVTAVMADAEQHRLL